MSVVAGPSLESDWLKCLESIVERAEQELLDSRDLICTVKPGRPMSPFVPTNEAAFLETPASFAGANGDYGDNCF